MVRRVPPPFVALGAAVEPERAPETTIEGFYMGLAERSFQVR